MDAGTEIYEKTKPTAVREVDGEQVLVEMDDSGKEMLRVHLVNEVGARIFELINGSRSLQDLSREICREFDGDPDHIENDLKTFVSELCNMGQIRLRTGKEAR